MSSQRYVTPLRIKPGFSIRLASLLVLAHAGGLAMLATLPWLWWQLMLLGSMVMLSLVHALGRHVLLRHSRSITEVTWASDGQWRFVTRDGDSFSALLSGSSFLHPQLVILNFNRSRWKRFSVVLFRDALDQESFRKLRVRLGREACAG